MRAKKEIEAIHDQDLPKLLMSLSIFDDFRDGKLHCIFCGEVITQETIGAIITESGEINFCCSDLLCLNNIESDV